MLALGCGWLGVLCAGCSTPAEPLAVPPSAPVTTDVTGDVGLEAEDLPPAQDLSPRPDEWEPSAPDTPPTPEDSGDTAAGDASPVKTDGGPCVPDCAEKQCGDDGCGKLCGICTFPAYCSTAGLCVGPCEADCTGRVCGSDGCEGTCGQCAPPLICSEAGQCEEPICVPDCEGRLCGEDGCDGSCGECPTDFTCDEAGKCQPPACVPDCTDKVCGDDGCEGVCGQCLPDELCDAGKCVPGPCSGIPKEGLCEGQVAIRCVGGEKVTENCSATVGWKCSWDAEHGIFGCVEEVVCTPTCDGKQCGPDGCGGVCGNCPTGWPCQAGACQLAEGGACGYVTPIGKCLQGILWTCQDAVLQKESCLSQGLFCAYEPSLKKNVCQ